MEFALSVIGSEPKRILEIACGSGRILVPLAKVGHNVTGLDFDKYMLSKIESKSVRMDNITSLGVKLMQSTMIGAMEEKKWKNPEL
ncbi:MAG: class I SAM-dependent methyltransferase [Clostridiales bacterium]|nr:class I SAM-dependent methyltransferase [Clostridiales bacterium]